MIRTFVGIVAAAIVASTSALADSEQVWLTMDQVRPYTLEADADQIVIGNPGIADVTVHDKRRVFLFGKAPGLTNIYIFDDAGREVGSLEVRVRSQSSAMLTMNRGRGRTTYNCTHVCEATGTVGDDTATFESVIAQSQSKLRQVTATAGN